MLGPRRPSAPPEDTYYAGLMKVVEQSIKENPKWFRTIASKVIASVDDTVQSRMTAKKIVSMEKI